MADAGCLKGDHNEERIRKLEDEVRQNTDDIVHLKLSINELVILEKQRSKTASLFRTGAVSLAVTVVGAVILALIGLK